MKRYTAKAPMSDEVRKQLSDPASAAALLHKCGTTAQPEMPALLDEVVARVKENATRRAEYEWRDAVDSFRVAFGSRNSLFNDLPQEEPSGRNLFIERRVAAAVGRLVGALIRLADEPSIKPSETD